MFPRKKCAESEGDSYKDVGMCEYHQAASCDEGRSRSHLDLFQHSCSRSAAVSCALERAL